MLSPHLGNKKLSFGHFRLRWIDHLGFHDVAVAAGSTFGGGDLLTELLGHDFMNEK